MLTLICTVICCAVGAAWIAQLGVKIWMITLDRITAAFGATKIVIEVLQWIKIREDLRKPQIAPFEIIIHLEKKLEILKKIHLRRVPQHDPDGCPVCTTFDCNDPADCNDQCLVWCTKQETKLDANEPNDGHSTRFPDF